MANHREIKLNKILVKTSTSKSDKDEYQRTLKHLNRLEKKGVVGSFRAKTIKAGSPFLPSESGLV